MHGKGPTTHPDLLIGIDGADDAGVFRIREDLLLIQTADFFTPIVDEAFDWGRIAAANALSDVYAMGGRPLTALQLIGWPRDRLSFDLLGDVVDGGLHVLDEAGCVLAGGHSIADPAPKSGFAVTGTAAPAVLTKPIGTGVIATAIKHGVCDDEIRDGAVATMAELNAEAAEAARVVGIVAGTDVTGFGLLGHLSEVATASGVTASIVAASVPLLAGASDLASAGHITLCSGNSSSAESEPG
jgi:selenide,water dikinase